MEATPKFFPTQSTHKNSVDTLEVATLYKHGTAEMGILESPLTSQPKEGTKGRWKGGTKWRKERKLKKEERKEDWGEKRKRVRGSGNEGMGREWRR